jgi:hypothetical protein
MTEPITDATTDRIVALNVAREIALDETASNEDRLGACWLLHESERRPDVVHTVRIENPAQVANNG